MPGGLGILTALRHQLLLGRVADINDKLRLIEDRLRIPSLNQLLQCLEEVLGFLCEITQNGSVEVNRDLNTRRHKRGSVVLILRDVSVTPLKRPLDDLEVLAGDAILDRPIGLRVVLLPLRQALLGAVAVAMEVVGCLGRSPIKKATFILDTDAIVRNFQIALNTIKGNLNIDLVCLTLAD